MKERKQIYFTPDAELINDFFRKQIPSIKLDEYGYSKWHYVKGFEKNCGHNTPAHINDIKLMKEFETEIFKWQRNAYSHCELSNKICNRVSLSNKPTIFLYWHQGKDLLPDLQQMCYDRLVKVCSSKYNILMLDKNTIDAYIRIPRFVKIALEERRIWMQHYVDYVRLCLLEHYEGIWLDATVFMKECPTYETFDYQFWSIKAHNLFVDTWAENVIPTMHECQIYAMGGTSNRFYSYMRQIFEYHLIHYGVIYSYYMMYYIAEYLIERDVEIAKQFKELDYNNEDVEILANQRCKNIEEVDKMYNASSTKMFKLIKYQTNEDDAYKIYQYLKERDNETSKIS